MIRSFFFAKTLPICKKFHCLLVRIYGDFCHILHTVNVTFSTNMNEWFIRQPCFICIKGIFLIFAVKCHQPFMVHAIFTAFVSGICCEIKHIPYKATPYIRTGRNRFPVLYMIIGLPVLRMPPTVWHGFYQRILLMINAGTGTILTNGNTNFRMISMHTVQPAS